MIVLIFSLPGYSHITCVHMPFKKTLSSSDWGKSHLKHPGQESTKANGGTVKKTSAAIVHPFFILSTASPNAWAICRDVTPHLSLYTVMFQGCGSLKTWELLNPF
jgi:hypothetical protein